MMKKPKLLYVLTASRSIKLLDGQLEYMAARGYEVHLITTPGEEIRYLSENIHFHALSMEREISILKDIKALFHILKLMRQIKPDIINYGTPKASLIASITAKICKVPKRIYTMRGLRLETITGFKKRFLIWIEKRICQCSDEIICVSPSLLEKVAELKLAKQSKLYCIKSGSSNGLNIDKFQNMDIEEEQIPLITAEDQVVGYVGRLTKDKGIDDLVDSFILIQDQFPKLKLLLVGKLEKNHGLKANTVIQMRLQRNIIHLDFQKNIAPLYRKMHVFVLPTYREGFANVAMEAAYSRLPVITTNVTGAKDAIINGETGLLVSAKKPEALAEAIKHLLENPEKAREMGSLGRHRIEAEFKRETIWEGLIAIYQF
ncbi:glycosyltransferase family 4 protein [Listeria booriae]|nr:glycosyltransferase family 4 protein [Listeria booriae]MBC1574022.1 glycosyltransferase family 4 protein [Listeria booriae]